ncbi:MAG: ABC transporter permease [Acidobacteria bacterium]|nr:ABC transporter permease [Acidobacteriota bacterium]
MKKFLAIVKHEYKRVVLKWSFLISTLLLPFLAVCFAFVPMIIFSLKGEPMRIAVADPSGKLLPRIEKNLSVERMIERAQQAAKDSMTQINGSQDEKMRNTAASVMQDFVLVPYDLAGRSGDAVRTDLISKVVANEIDAFLIVPDNFDSAQASFVFRSRKGGDFISNDTFQDALNNAVRSQRLADANISEESVAELSAPVNFDAKGIDEAGVEKDSSGVMAASFVIGLMIYITLAIYGQAIMAAVVEEKETRIAEILFSSARPFKLMLGKLVGVGLAGLTQLAIWVGSAAALLAFLALQTDFRQILATVPSITPVMITLFLTYFLLGFFLYASIFALIGSMVTSVQEGGQFAFIPVMIMLAAFYFCFAVIRDPNSDLSFWVTISPFLAPITMPVRILAETPPAWQIALSFLINAATITGLVWVAARVYRVGMLMYGKRATIPEVWKWIRQA